MKRAALLFVLALGLAPAAFAGSAASVDALAQKDVGLDALAKKAKDPNEKERRSAVQELAKLGTPAAWDLVLDLLKDASPMVADEAQVQLGKLADEKFVKELLGKRGLQSGDVWVRRRAAEVLGRVRAPVSQAELSGRMEQEDPEVKRMLAWSVERRFRSGSWHLSDLDELERISAALGRLVKDSRPEVRAAALSAVGAASAKKDQPVAAEFLVDKSAEVRCAALVLALEWEASARFDAARNGVADAAFAVRAQAVETLASCGTKAACALLVDRLEKETSLRLRWRIVAELQKLSGSDLELNVPFWRKWVEGLDDVWHPATGERKPPKEVKEQGTTVFLGLPVLSDRVAILVDFSGSLWEKRADGKTRKETADEELAKLLKQLPPAAKFNVIPYTSKPFPWEKQLVPATKENVARALDAFVKCKETGKGNVWDAIELAITDPEVDTLLILTDGAPTGGHRWNLELMEPLLHEKLRFRKLAIDAVLVDAKKFLQDRWRAICEGTGGRMQAVEMK
ncbi:MAG: HEAT repeat domain-containing protein [Planctomycetes bacterium]|nr:HEAT repeat domain-containing protein [Planctomycetota bacterium]